jgi:hypothetical protein
VISRKPKTSGEKIVQMANKKPSVIDRFRRKEASRKKTAPRVLPDAADQVRPTAGLSREEMPDRSIFSRLYGGTIDRGQPLKR